MEFSHESPKSVVTAEPSVFVDQLDIVGQTPLDQDAPLRVVGRVPGLKVGVDSPGHLPSPVVWLAGVMLLGRPRRARQQQSDDNDGDGRMPDVSQRPRPAHRSRERAAYATASSRRSSVDPRARSSSIPVVWRSICETLASRARSGRGWSLSGGAEWAGPGGCRLHSVEGADLGGRRLGSTSSPRQASAPPLTAPGGAPARTVVRWPRSRFHSGRGVGVRWPLEKRARRRYPGRARRCGSSRVGAGEARRERPVVEAVRPVRS
jgi:hypothetical protein